MDTGFSGECGVRVKVGEMWERRGKVADGSGRVLWLMIYVYKIFHSYLY